MSRSLNDSLLPITLMDLIQKLPKSVIFAAVAAVGCFIAAILAEPLFIETAPIIIPQPPEPPSPFFCFCFDDSGSMGGNKRQAVKKAAKDFVLDRNLDKEKVGIVVFDGSSRVFLSLSHDKNAVLSKIDSYYLGGGTAFAGALHDAMTEFGNDSEIGQINNDYKSKTEQVNTKIDEANKLIGEGRVKAEKIPALLPLSVPKIVLFFTDGQNGDRPQTLQKAQELREKGIKIYAVATQDGDKNYLAQMTGDSSQVYMTSDTNIGSAFKQMEQKINADISAAQPDFLKNMSKTKADKSGELEITVGTKRSMQIIQATVWSMLLCLGMCIFIAIVQNRMMRKPLVIPMQLATLAVGGAAGGVAAGFIGDAAFQLIPVVFIGRLVGLGLLGAILAFGMSFFIANLDRKWALIGGAVGGVLGSLGFLIITSIMADTGGRLIGAAILGACIGAMIGWVETMFRNAWLMVMYDPRNFTQVNLGTQLVTVGGSNRDMIFINGAEPNLGTFQMSGNTVQYKTKNGTQTLNPGDRVNIGSVELVVCSKDVLFAVSKFYPMRMSKVPR
ncbi:MAG: VWA domain-containing protein [Planctomycetaceae bacterium]|jgi:Ca-activated chloride channel family protein|nr:VWA domain-containing protein [Planctomycetaceae bacterium]